MIYIMRVFTVLYVNLRSFHLHLLLTLNLCFFFTLNNFDEHYGERTCCNHSHSYDEQCFHERKLLIGIIRSDYDEIFEILIFLLSILAILNLNPSWIGYFDWLWLIGFDVNKSCDNFLLPFFLIFDDYFLLFSLFFLLHLNQFLLFFNLLQ